MSERSNTHIMGLWTLMAALVTSAATLATIYLNKRDDQGGRGVKNALMRPRLRIPTGNGAADHATPRGPQLPIGSLSEYVEATRYQRTPEERQQREQLIRRAAGRPVVWRGYVTETASRSFRLTPKRPLDGGGIIHSIKVDAATPKLQSVVGTLRERDAVQVKGTLRSHEHYLRLEASEITPVDGS